MAEAASVGPAEAAPAGTALAEGTLAPAAPAVPTAPAVPAAPAAPAEEALDTAVPGEGALDTAAPEDGTPDTAAPQDGTPDIAARAEWALDTAAAKDGAPEPEPDFTESGPGFAGRDFAERDFGAPDFAEPGSEPVSKLAVLALVTGLVALVPIAVASGVAALVGIRRTGRGGHGMAMAGLFLSAAWVIIAIAIGTVGVVTHGFHKPVTIKYREAAVFTLHEGDCVDSPNAQLVSILPCSTPHEAEVFATFALPASPWPGTTAIATAASSGCGTRLNGYLNPQLAISLTQSYVYPDQVAWTAGTRTVVCEVRASSGNLTGSVRGATLAQN
jgi:Septum formation